ncbi:unnamed protein product [Adineta ricciae]|uniref:3CxxC-type domain-containing protein n=1 Tax=Adineta ricciae TaxID=249248 RepID=A0A815PX27_ADIRI|nr:unnamed protein product [Adineta ricciae]
MSLRAFRSALGLSLYDNPLPNGDRWIMQRLTNVVHEYYEGWFDVLYRMQARYRCKSGHDWTSSWTMILFRFYRNEKKHFGLIRLKRFGQRCAKCKDDREYYTGSCTYEEVWYITQCVLFHILQKCYEKRPIRDLDVLPYIIGIQNVPSNKPGGMAHQKEYCEACAANYCKEMFKELNKKH